MAGIDIHDVRITLAPDPNRPELLARASFLVAALCIRDIKIVRTSRGSLRVVFPDRPIGIGCDRCGRHIPMTHAYCFNCGAPQSRRPVELNRKGVPMRYESIMFPVSTEARGEYEGAILAAYSLALSEAELATVPQAKAS